MSALDLDAIEARAQAATPGPWLWEGESFMGCGEVFTMGEGVLGGSIAGPTGDCYPRSGYMPQGDMKFIASAREDVPAMASRLREIGCYLSKTIDNVNGLTCTWENAEVLELMVDLMNLFEGREIGAKS